MPLQLNYYLNMILFLIGIGKSDFLKNYLRRLDVDRLIYLKKGDYYGALAWRIGGDFGYQINYGRVLI